MSTVLTQCVYGWVICINTKLIDANLYINNSGSVKKKIWEENLNSAKAIKRFLKSIWRINKENSARRQESGEWEEGGMLD